MASVKYMFHVKPISANMMFAGTQYYKRKQYVAYQTIIYASLHSMEAFWTFGKRPVSINVVAGLSSRASDLDNIIKPLLDTLQSYHMFTEFDDKAVYEIYLRKELVKRGKEYLDVTISDFLKE